MMKIKNDSDKVLEDRLPYPLHWAGSAGYRTTDDMSYIHSPFKGWLLYFPSGFTAEVLETLRTENIPFKLRKPNKKAGILFNHIHLVTIEDCWKVHTIIKQLHRDLCTI